MSVTVPSPTDTPPRAAERVSFKREELMRRLQQVGGQRREMYMYSGSLPT